MREILFRGKNKHDGKWFYGFSVLDKNGQSWIFTGEVLSSFSMAGEWSRTPVDSDTVGQYTGLRDKNDVKIFEGDIVKGHYYKAGVRKRLVGKVAFGYNGWIIEGLKQYKGTAERLTVSYEIIGNVHENPELLEVE